MDPRLRHGVIGLAGVAYALLSHWLMTHQPGSVLALAALLGPMLALALAGVWRDGRPLLAAALALVATLLLGAASRGTARLSPQWLYLAQHAAIHAGLGLVFGASLRGGREPLVTGIASRVHRGLKPTQARYTRRVTLVWTLYFAAMAGLSLLLFVVAPFAVWSLFANVLTPLSLGAMFIGEHLLRYRLHPDFERVGVMAAIRAYNQGPVRS